MDGKYKMYLHVLICLLLILPVSAQEVVHVKKNVEGTIQLAEGIAIPKIKAGYTAWLPVKKPKGLVVFLHGVENPEVKGEIVKLALENNLAIMYVTTDNRLEFFFDEEKMAEVEEHIHTIVSDFQIPKGNILYCGMSLEGTRALKLAIYSQSKHSNYQITPRAIAICDAPLDMIRFHKEMVKAKKLNYNETASNEGNWVSSYLESNLGGSPKEVREAYIDYSPYCYSANGGIHLTVLKKIAIRAYTEPDVHWWMQNRRKDYYSMNTIDLAALVNELTILGNEEAELIITNNKGYLPDGRRHPHSWSIVDEQELIEWFTRLIHD